MKQQQPRLVPYRQKGELPRKAAILRIDFDDTLLKEQEKQLLAHLKDAADCMHPVSVSQKCMEAPGLTAFLDGMIAVTEGDLRQALIDYRAVLYIQNSPWADQPKKTPVLQADPHLIEEAARHAGLGKELERYRALLWDDVPLNPRAGFYPEDFMEEELRSLGEEGLRVNTLVRRDREGNPSVIVNEHYFRDACAAAAVHLRRARRLVEDPGFGLYLDAKIEELATGSEEARRLADYHWIRHDYSIDIILSTAIEVYADGWKNIKGAAAAAVTVKNSRYDRFLDKVLTLAQDLESRAPWKWRRTEIAPETLPRLKFVDVFSWTGDYLGSPGTVMAQSLPNDEWVGENIGTVNLVYRNVCDAIFSITKAYIAEEFLPREISSRYMDLFAWADHVHSILHELGHTTGRQDPDHPGKASAYLGSEYSPLEETRAELFGMWAAEKAKEAGIIETEVEEAALYVMLLSMVFSLAFVPEQAHVQARNLIFHHLEEKGGILRKQEAGKTVFLMDLEAVRSAAAELLGTVGDLKASGDKAGVEKLRGKYCYTDQVRDEVDRRLQDQPRGRGLIFPDYPRSPSSGGPQGKLFWPGFEDQVKFRLHFPREI